MARKAINATHVIAFQDGGHRHLRDGYIVVEDDRIMHVGDGRFEGGRMR